MSEIKISETADKLINNFGLTQHRWSPDAWEHRQNLRAYIAELEAKAERAKWKTGHPEQLNKEVLVKVKLKNGFQQYVVDFWIGTRWCRTYESEVLGWRECDDYDLKVID